MWKQKHVIGMPLILLFLAGCGGSSSNEGGGTTPPPPPPKQEFTRAFFGDPKFNEVVVVDVEDFELVTLVPTHHQVTYTADKIADTGKLYVVNRGSNAIDVMDADGADITNTIALEHYPRSSESVNTALGLVAVTGMNKPMVSLIDMNTDQVIATVGNDEITFPVEHNYTGSHACGHPFWLDNNHFILPDRENLQLHTYHIEKQNGQWVTNWLSTVHTPSPVHQIIPSKGNFLGEANTFYATAEGITRGDNMVYPSILELKLNPGQDMYLNREVLLKGDTYIGDMGLHHGDFHPSEKLIYVGSREGTLYLVDYETMSIHSTIEAGRGIGHVQMLKSINLAIGINHNDVFVTIIDLATNTKIKDVPVSNSTHLVGQATIQAHPRYHVSKDNSKFYSFVTSDGDFYELDTSTLNVTKKLQVGGNPSQGSFVALEK